MSSFKQSHGFRLLFECEFGHAVAARNRQKAIKPRGTCKAHGTRQKTSKVQQHFKLPKLNTLTSLPETCMCCVAWALIPTLARSAQLAAL